MAVAIYKVVLIAFLGFGGTVGFILMWGAELYFYGGLDLIAGILRGEKFEAPLWMLLGALFFGAFPGIAFGSMGFAKLIGKTNKRSLG